MHTFKHPKYYKEMRAERRKLQAASPKQQAIDETIPYNDIEEASSPKPQAEASSSRRQASSPKQEASSSKPEVTSSLIREPRNI